MTCPLTFVIQKHNENTGSNLYRLDQRLKFEMHFYFSKLIQVRCLPNQQALNWGCNAGSLVMDMVELSRTKGHETKLLTLLF